MENTNKGLFIAISGPSGVGKGEIIKMLRQHFKEAEYVISDTTRPPRPGEINGFQYNFLSKDDFQNGIAAGKYLEWQQVHQDAFYGVLREPVEKALESGKIVIREVDFKGYFTIKKILSPEQLVSIFIAPGSFEDLKNHIIGRSKISDVELERRLESARMEVEASNEFDYEVINFDGKIEECFTDVMSIIFDQAEKRGLLTKRV